MTLALLALLFVVSVLISQRTFHEATDRPLLQPPLMMLATRASKVKPSRRSAQVALLGGAVCLHAIQSAGHALSLTLTPARSSARSRALAPVRHCWLLPCGAAVPLGWEPKKEVRGVMLLLHPPGGAGLHRPLLPFAHRCRRPWRFPSRG